MTKQERDKIKKQVSDMENDKIESLIFTQEKRLEREKFIFDVLVAERYARSVKRKY